MFHVLLKKLEHSMRLVTGGLFFSILLVTVTNILLRNILGVSWLFMDGLLRLLFIWMVFLGTSVLYYNDDHLIMNFFSDKFSKISFTRLQIIQDILFILFMGVLIIYGFQVVKVRMTIPFETWNVATGYAYMSVPVNAFIMILFTIQKLQMIRKGTNE